MVTGVSAHRELFEQAAAAGAQLVLCHHGIFWGESAGPVTEQLKARLKLLFDNDMTLAAYHLPLDAHPEVGNNALICEGLGLERGEAFGEAKGEPIGWIGARAGAAVRSPSSSSAARRSSAPTPLVFDSGPAEIRRVGDRLGRRQLDAGRGGRARPGRVRDGRADRARDGGRPRGRDPLHRRRPLRQRDLRRQAAGRAAGGAVRRPAHISSRFRTRSSPLCAQIAGKQLRCPGRCRKTDLRHSGQTGGVTRWRST